MSTIGWIARLAAPWVPGWGLSFEVVAVKLEILSSHRDSDTRKCLEEALRAAKEADEMEERVAEAERQGELAEKLARAHQKSAGKDWLRRFRHIAHYTGDRYGEVQRTPKRMMIEVRIYNLTELVATSLGGGTLARVPLSGHVDGQPLNKKTMQSLCEAIVETLGDPVADFVLLLDGTELEFTRKNFNLKERGIACIGYRDNCGFYAGEVVLHPEHAEPVAHGHGFWAIGEEDTLNERTFLGGMGHNLPNGCGRFCKRFDFMYRGQVEDGAPCGKGVFKYSNEDEYKGECSNGQRCGKGVFYEKSTQKEYIGEYKDGKFQEDTGTVRKVGEAPDSSGQVREISDAQAEREAAVKEALGAAAEQDQAASRLKEMPASATAGELFAQEEAIRAQRAVEQLEADARARARDADEIQRGVQEAAEKADDAKKQALTHTQWSNSAAVKNWGNAWPNYKNIREYKGDKSHKVKPNDASKKSTGQIVYECACYTGEVDFVGQSKRPMARGCGFFAGDRDGSDSRKYWGQMDFDIPNGYGEFQDGHFTYTGQVVNGASCGIGVLKWPWVLVESLWSRDVYKGEFKDGLPHGIGVFIACKTGKEYIVKYTNGIQLYDSIGLRPVPDTDSEANVHRASWCMR